MEAVRRGACEPERSEGSSRASEDEGAASREHDAETTEILLTGHAVDRREIAE